MTDDLTTGRTSRIDKALEFKRGKDIGVGAIAIFLQGARVEHFVTGGKDDRADLTLQGVRAR